MPYRMIRATRHTVDARDPLFKPDYSLRVGHALLRPADPTEVMRDVSRQVTLLPTPDSTSRYVEQLLHLASRDYMQGDLTASSDLVGVVNVLTGVNMEMMDNDADQLTPHLNDALTPVLREQRFSYLRDDDNIGGVSVRYNPYTNENYLTVAFYRDVDASYDDALIYYFLPEACARQVLTPEAFNDSVLIDNDHDFSIEIQAKIMNADVTSLVAYCLHHPLLFKCPPIEQSGQLGLDHNVTNVGRTDAEAVIMKRITPHEILCEALCRLIRWTAEEAIQALDDPAEVQVAGDILNILMQDGLMFVDKYTCVTQHLRGCLTDLPEERWHTVKDDVTCFYAAQEIILAHASTEEKAHLFAHFEEDFAETLSHNPLLHQIIKQNKTNALRSAATALRSAASDGDTDPELSDSSRDTPPHWSR